MKLIKSYFIKVKNLFTPIEISIGPVIMDVGEMYDPPNLHGDFQEVQSLVNHKNGSSVFILKDEFQILRNEIESNLLMPIDIRDKVSYLKEILDFYSELEEKIIEDDKGTISSDAVKFIDKPLNEMMDFHKDEYAGFLESLRKDLREEILYVIKKLNQFEMKKGNPDPSEQKLNSDIIWKRDKGDLIELVKALCLIGAISNSTNNLTEKEAYRILGNLFGEELKYASDIIKNKSKYQKKEYFLEELHDKFQEHLSTIRGKK